MASADVISAPYPAQSQSTSTMINGLQTDVTCISFSDKILLTVSQRGGINHWVHVPLGRAAPGDLVSLSQPPSFAEGGPDTSLLPFSQLTATTILGGTKPELEVTGQTLATTIASAILMRRGEEQRTLVLGLGLIKADFDKTSFDELVGSCLDVL